MNLNTIKISGGQGKILLGIFSLFALLFFVSCKGKESSFEQNSAKETANASLKDLINLVDKAIISSQETITPEETKLGGVIALNGFITRDPRRDNAVAARIAGRVERLFVKYNFQHIKKGEKVLEIYSPALRVSQEEYLYLLKTSKDSMLIQNAKRKLLLLGLSEKQIENLTQTGKVALTISVYSPANGYVLLNEQENIVSIDNTTNSTEMSMSSSPNGSATSGQTVAEGILKEGSYVNKGQTLFKINDFKSVWAQLTVKPENQKIITLNTPVKIFIEGNPLSAVERKIDFIEPVFSGEIQFLQARVYLKNPDNKLKANALITAELQLFDKKMVLVPNTSISDLGKDKIVWVKTNEISPGKKVFKPRRVVTGIVFDEKTEIIEGLKSGESIAKDAGFLLDSESIIEQ